MILASLNAPRPVARPLARPATLSARRIPGKKSRRRPRFTVEQIQSLVSWQPRYQPYDVAELIGLSEDRVTDSILDRPNLFPARERYVRRHEWNEAEFVRVILVMCSLSTRAATNVAEKIREFSA